MTTPTSDDPTAALVAALGGADASDETLAARVGALPVATALSLGLFLARADHPAARDLAGRVFDLLRALQGDLVSLDDNLARLALALDRPNDALAVLEARLERSESLGACRWLIRTYLALNRVDDARTLVERLLRERGDRMTVWLMRGDVALAARDYATAEESFRRSLDLAPGSTLALVGLAHCAAAQGDIEGTRALVTRLAAAYQDRMPSWLLSELTEAALRIGDGAWLADLEAERREVAAREARMVLITLQAAQSGNALDTQRDPRAARRGRNQTVQVAVARARAIAPVTDDDADDDDALPLPEAAAEEEPPAPELLDALRDHFGYESFLPGQAEVIRAVLAGEDVLALLPTGAGKSLCYQLPALLLPGTTVLISPLIALMKDQMDNLPAAVRARTTIINSLVERDALEQRLLDIGAGRYKLVYAAPERLRQQSFVHALRRAGVARFVVDEAHCVSLWGHDFRPDYLFIAKALRQLSEARADGQPPPVLALTATATPEVRDSIAAALERDLRVINRGVFRPNLRYEVINVANNDDRLRTLARILEETPGAAIVYVRSREGCEDVAEFLRRRCRIAAVHYHAGMQRDEREAAQNDFIAGRARVVAATVAFGMGIDKPDVRCIVHYQLPGSLEAYTQESGRAGRDGRPSRCVLFVSAADVGQVRRHITQDELTIETLRAVYAATRGLVRAGAPPGASAGRVAASDLERDITDAIQASDTKGQQVDETAARVALSLLERAGYLRRHPDVPRAPSVRMASELPEDPAESAAFQACTAAARLRPYQPQTLDLVALASALRLAPAALEERLLSWRDAGLIEYRDGARDLLLEMAPPPESKSALPDLLNALTERHERQIASLVRYTRATRCRQREIAAHFGERLPVRACGGCDRCRAGTGEQAVTPRHGAVVGRRSIQSNAAPAPDGDAIRAAIFACLAELPYAVGISGVVRVLRGSPDTPPSAAR
ncbi:MAG TPA: RecQ family ATP-dependent DNA helicase, partial [Ktedonobacterales bacterium]